MTEYNLSFLELMRVVKPEDRILCDHSNAYLVLLPNDEIAWKTNNKPISHPFDYSYRILKPEPKLVKWYRPSVIWLKTYKIPIQCRADDFRQSKEAWDEYLNTSKVLEWEIKEFPATWEECDGDT